MKQISIFALAAIIFFSCNNESDPPESTVNPGNNPVSDQPAVIGYKLVQTFPHDRSSFTEGLQFVDGKLLESTGEYGQSELRLSELETGKPLKQVALDKIYFGEGCTQLNGKIYQMTYKENTCFVYDAASFKKLDEIRYGFGEGWGMTTDGQHLIISNGSSNIFFYDPETFKEVKRVGVSNQYGPVGNINELEMIKGYLYANVWQSDNLIKIDTASGKVVGVVVMNDLRSRIGIEPYSGIDGDPEVLNGIAYDAKADRVFITGKNWPKLCEIKLND